jgi:hypothetical protein
MYKEDTGYSLNCLWPTNINNQSIWESHKLSISTSMYMEWRFFKNTYLGDYKRKSKEIYKNKKKQKTTKIVGFTYNFV